MHNRIDQLFASGKKNILNIYCTAGFPQCNDTLAVLRALQESGADMVELGIPYSDPVADGPVIQQSNKKALDNGMTCTLLFAQLQQLRPQISLPVILMGYLNPVLQFGVEAFCEAAAKVGVDGIIIPDLPVDEFQLHYKAVFEKYGLHFIFLVTPETPDERVRLLDAATRGFLYAVSSSSTTGSGNSIAAGEAYFLRLKELGLVNPVLVGFGIADASGFAAACRHTRGAICGSAYIRKLQHAKDIAACTKEFVKALRGG